jgi:hypothetical protein
LIVLPELSLAVTTSGIPSEQRVGGDAFEAVVVREFLSRYDVIHEM